MNWKQYSLRMAAIMKEWMKRELDRCTHAGRFPLITCFGIQHALISIVVLGIGYLVSPWTVPGLSITLTSVFIARELAGQGNLWKDADRLLDWLLPLLVCVVMTSLVLS